ncbi:MAG TPA: lipase secretion chaperone [Burkholderiaceae bacterium]|jgi:lipase chaperone LimK|nr:lipase secretion chaperone [Burkholderiaceae bacterium]
MKTGTLIVVGSVTLVATVFCSTVLMRPAEHIAPQVVAEPNMFSFVHSLAGTNPPDLTVNVGDVLVADVELRHMFDYYLSASSETTPEKIRAKIEAELDRTLNPRAATEAKRLLARYLDYREAVMEMQKNPQMVVPGISPIRARLLAVQQTRARFFTAKEVEGMFGADDAHDMDAVARLEINQDKSLTPAQKKEKLLALDAAMPAALREARDAPLKVANMEESVLKMRADGATEDDIYRMRAKVFSPEAASRLADLDRQTLDWNKRIASYQADRKGVLGNAALSDQDRQTAIQQLRDAHFSSEEQRRLAAYE